MRMRWTAILAAGGVSALLLVGCGGSTGALGLAASDDGAPDVAASVAAGEGAPDVAASVAAAGAQLDDALPEVDAQPAPVQDDWAHTAGQRGSRQ